MGTINMYDDSSTLIDNNVLNNESVYDILNATVDEGLMKGVAESTLEFKDSSSIILYTSLNKTNTQLLMQDKYNEIIFAHEYLEASLGIKQSEFIIKFSYNTQGLYDTLHPKAYSEIQQIIKKNKLNKSNINDMQIVKELLKTYTGVRVHSIDNTKKCYDNTNTIFNNSKLVYIVKPTDIHILSIQPLI